MSENAIQVSGNLATPRQIRKLYVVVRNSGVKPEDYFKKLVKEKGVKHLNELTKKELSKQIDQFENENHNEKTEVAEASEEEKGKEEVVEELENPEKKTGVVKELEDSLTKIDASFCACIAKASKTVSKEFANTEEIQGMILDIAKIYFEELREGAERG